MISNIEAISKHIGLNDELIIEFINNGLVGDKSTKSLSDIDVQFLEYLNSKIGDSKNRKYKVLTKHICLLGYKNTNMYELVSLKNKMGEDNE